MLVYFFGRFLNIFSMFIFLIVFNISVFLFFIFKFIDIFVFNIIEI